MRALDKRRSGNRKRAGFSATRFSRREIAPSCSAQARPVRLAATEESALLQEQEEMFGAIGDPTLEDERKWATAALSPHLLLVRPLLSC